MAKATLIVPLTISLAAELNQVSRSAAEIYVLKKLYPLNFFSFSSSKNKKKQQNLLFSAVLLVVVTALVYHG